MSEIRIGEIPIPLINYVYLIQNRKSPYFDIVQLLLKEMERHYLNAQKDGRSEITYTINPRILTDEIELLVQSQNKEKLTNINVCRTILALCYGSKLKEEKDFYTSITSSGRRNYHIRVNQRTLNAFSRMIL
jgi:hypothetical protein